MIPGVPGGYYRTILAAFVAALKSDPRLANNRVIRTWIVWDGKSPVAPPPEDALPAIQVRLLGGPVKRLASTRLPGKPMTYVNECHPTILIDLATRGTDQGDLADLAQLVTGALSPQDPAARAALEARLRDAGIKDWQLKRDILPTSAESFALEGVAGQGSYELTAFVNS